MFHAQTLPESHFTEIVHCIKAGSSWDCVWNKNKIKENSFQPSLTWILASLQIAAVAAMDKSLPVVIWFMYEEISNEVSERIESSALMQITNIAWFSFCFRLKVDLVLFLCEACSIVFSVTCQIVRLKRFFRVFFWIIIISLSGVTWRWRQHWREERKFTDEKWSRIEVNFKFHFLCKLLMLLWRPFLLLAQCWLCCYCSCSMLPEATAECLMS